MYLILLYFSTLNIVVFVCSWPDSVVPAFTYCKHLVYMGRLSYSRDMLPLLICRHLTWVHDYSIASIFHSRFLLLLVLDIFLLWFVCLSLLLDICCFRFLVLYILHFCLVLHLCVTSIAVVSFPDVPFNTSS